LQNRIVVHKAPFENDPTAGAVDEARVALLAKIRRSFAVPPVEQQETLHGRAWVDSLLGPLA
jgi:hypothetical protein